jgi:RNA polymerase sigma-70 factor (ECF subfamily)
VKAALTPAGVFVEISEMLYKGAAGGEAGGRGQREDFRETFREFFPRLRSYFLAHGFAASDAEDLSQNALWSVYRSKETFRGEGSLDAWVYTIARNLARDEWRKRGRAFAQEPLDEAIPDAAPSPQDRTEDRLELDRTVAALARLPTRMRACLLLHVQQNLSYGEIATRLSLAVPTVKVQIWNARRRLREILEAGS